MDNKYYTPAIEEFHIGFEFEYLASDDTWQETTYNPLRAKEDEEDYIITLGVINQMLLHKDRDKHIRVKCLDKQDIESLGWKYDTLNNNNCYDLKHWLLIDEYFTKDKGILVVISDDDNESSFQGYIKNKSELKRVMSQLGIIYEKEC